MKKILILGGTLFLGRNIIEQLLGTTNYSITLFNRGITNSQLFPNLKRIYGDRYNIEDYKQIIKEEYDCLIDTSGYYPEHLKNEVKLLKGKVKRYIFISTISVYDFDKIQGPLVEENELLECTEKELQDKSQMKFGNLSKPALHLYGKKKAECEKILQECPWLDTIILRPAIIYGKYDFCDRYYYWLYRIKMQQEILIPNKGDDVQNNTFVEDLAGIVIQSIKIKKHSGVYNVTTHPPLSLKETLAQMGNVLGTQPDFVYTPQAFLKKHNVRPYFEIPTLWDGFDVIIDDSKLQRDFNINFFSFSDSIRITADYYDRIGWKEPKDGISIKKEKQLLELLKY